MNDSLIDVWDLETFDPELIAILAAEAGTIRSYMIRDHEIFLAHDPWPWTGAFHPAPGQRSRWVSTR